MFRRDDVKSELQGPLLYRGRDEIAAALSRAVGSRKDRCNEACPVECFQGGQSYFTCRCKEDSHFPFLLFVLFLLS